MTTPIGPTGDDGDEAVEHGRRRDAAGRRDAPGRRDGRPADEHVDDRRQRADEGHDGDGADGTEALGAGKPPAPLTQQIGRVTLVVLLAIFGIFAADNSQRVDFSWIIGDTLVEPAAGGGSQGGVPLIVLLVASLLIGALLGALLEWQVLRSRRASRSERGRR